MKGNTEKSKHAVYLFEELKKFQKVGILCDVKLPARLESIQAHKVVLLSARSNSVDSCSDSDAYLSDADFAKEEPSDVFAVESAYSPCGSQQVSSGCEGCSSEEDSTLQRQLDIINDLRLNQECCDVRLVTDDDYCDAHRVVLAACSDYFRAMFITSQMVENDLATVKLQGISGQCFRKILGFMYTGEIAFNSIEDTVKLLDVSVYYQISLLVERCVAFLKEHITPEVCCYLTWISKELALQSLTESCLEFISNNFTELASVKCEVGYYLEASDLLTCLTSVSYPEGADALEFEMSLLSTVLHWFVDNHSVLSPIHEEILEQVRFALIPSDRITECCDTVMKSSTVESSGYNVASVFGPVVHSFICEAHQYHERLFAQPLMGMAKSGLRVECPSIVSIDGVMANNRVKVQQSAKNISLYSGPEMVPDSQTAEESSPMAIRDPYHNVVELNGFIYLLGGTRKFHPGFSTSVMRYDPRLDVWVEVADMNVPRGDFAVGVVDDCIIVAGGRSRRGYLNTCEMYDPGTNSWKFIAKLPGARYMAATCLVNGAFYISGGFDEHEALDTMLKYNSEKNKWERCGTPMMNERGYHVMIPGPKNKLWVVGGVDHPFSGRNVWDVEAFDVAKKRWSYVGQVLAVKPFLSTVRLNSFLNDVGNVTICPVTLSGGSDVMVEYQPNRRMWFEMKEHAASFTISVPAGESD
jgi:hypothetical protein